MNDYEHQIPTFEYLMTPLIRDVETEELIEDQQQRIRELDQENKGLKEKLLVAKNQLVGANNRPSSRRSPARRAPTLPPRAPSHLSHSGMLPSPAPSPAPHPSDRQQVQQINQKAMSLLEEARNENRMLEEAVTTLKEQVNIYEQEVDQIKEQARIKESNCEEEISILKTQLSQSQKQTVTENIELIRSVLSRIVKFNPILNSKFTEYEYSKNLLHC